MIKRLFRRRNRRTPWLFAYILDYNVSLLGQPNPTRERI